MTSSLDQVTVYDRLQEWQQSLRPVATVFQFYLLQRGLQQAQTRLCRLEDFLTFLREFLRPLTNPLEGDARLQRGLHRLGWSWEDLDRMRQLSQDPDHPPVWLQEAWPLFSHGDPLADQPLEMSLTLGVKDVETGHSVGWAIEVPAMPRTSLGQLVNFSQVAARLLGQELLRSEYTRLEDLDRHMQQALAPPDPDSATAERP